MYFVFFVQTELFFRYATHAKRHARTPLALTAHSAPPSLPLPLSLLSLLSAQGARLAEDNMTMATLSTRGDESIKMLAQENRQRVGLNRDVLNLGTQAEEEAKKEALRVDEISKTRTAVAMCTDRVAQVQADCASLEEQRAEQDELEKNGLAELAKREQAVVMKRAAKKTLKVRGHPFFISFVCSVFISFVC